MKGNIYKGYFDNESELSHKFSCWPNNHNGRSKMKKLNKKVARKRIKRDCKKYEYG